MNIISRQQYSECLVTIQQIFNSAFWIEPQGLSCPLLLCTVTNVKEVAGKISQVRVIYQQAHFVRRRWTLQQLHGEWQLKEKKYFLGISGSFFPSSTQNYCKYFSGVGFLCKASQEDYWRNSVRVRQVTDDKKTKCQLSTRLPGFLLLKAGSRSVIKICTKRKGVFLFWWFCNLEWWKNVQRKLESSLWNDNTCYHCDTLPLCYIIGHIIT